MIKSIHRRSLTPVGFRPEEDCRSRGNFAGARCAAGSTVVDSNGRAFAECEVQSLALLLFVLFNRIRVLSVLFSLVLAGTFPASGAGLTIVTHGFEAFPIAHDHGWVNAMSDYIADRAGGNAAVYEMVVDVDFFSDPLGQHPIVTASRLVSPPSENGNAEIIIRLFWDGIANPESANNFGVGSRKIAEAVAPYIYSGVSHPSAELPIHLIGHSRGASVMSELARILGERGIWAHQLTTLDTHPVAPFDARVDNVWETVLFADNYYEDISGTFPQGQSVMNAYNRHLTSLDGGYPDGIPILVPDGNHQDVHLWYHGTVNTNTTASDGEQSFTDSLRQAWYQLEETKGTHAGFYFSRLGGGSAEQSIVELSLQGLFLGYYNHGNFNTSPANRISLTRNANEWPNLITLTHDSTSSVKAGSSFPTRYVFQSFDSDSSVKLYLDTDQNPYNNNGEIQLVFNQTVNPQPLTQRGTRTIDVNVTVPVGTTPRSYYLYGKIENPNGTRYLYSLTQVRIDSDGVPPTAEIFAPSGGSVNGTVSVVATATDNIRVVKVEFYLDGVPKFTDGSSPYTWPWDTKLADNGSHQLVVKAYDDAGNIGTSSTITVTVNNSGDATPPVISNVRASTTVNSATITWTTSEPANGQIEYGIAPCLPCGSASPLVSSLIASHSSTLANLASSTTYNYRVFGRDAAGNLAISASFSFRTATTPNASPSVALGRPNGGEAYAVASVQAVTWNAVDDVAVTSVSLFYSTDGGVNWNSIASGLANSGSYSWTVPNAPSLNARVMVVAFDGSGASGSDVSDATFSILAICPTPATPVLQSISVPSSGNYTVAWNPVTGADYYILEESVTPGFASANSYNATGTSRFIVGLPGTWYYRVRAVNNCGQSATSGTQTASVVVDQGPGEIYAVSPPDNVTDQPLSVNLCWSCIHPGGEALRYTVYVVPADTEFFFSNNIKSSDQTATCFSVANLPYNTRVSWGVEAVDDTGQRRFSKMFHFTTIADSSVPTGSLSINNGATTTDTYSVTLLGSASDSGSGVAYMRFSNDGTNWTWWLRFAPQYPWNLADYNFGGRDGLSAYTVYGQFQDFEGNASAVYSDSITKVAGSPGNIILNGTLYATVRDAVDAAQAGDTIFLTEGVFTVVGDESPLRPHDPGRLVGVVLKPGVTLKGMGIQRTTITFENSFFGVVDATNSVIEGIKLVNSSSPSSTAACILIENSGSTVRNCWLTGSYNGVQVGWNQKPGLNATLENNLVTGNHQGIFVSYISSNIVFRNNTIAFNLPNGGILSQIGAIEVVNNIIISNGYQFAIPEGLHPTFRYNNVFPGTSGVGYQGLPPQTGINGNISTDPLFANASGADYRLSAGSACIDSGINVGIPFAGIAPDMGAFEYSATGTIRVSANRSNATFVVTGPQSSYPGSGTNWSIAGVPIGMYAIQFGPIPNLYSPQFQATMLYSGDTVVFGGTYREDTTPPAGNVVINYGEFATAEVLVTLSLDFTDEVAGMGTDAQMKFSNDGVDWSAPEPFSTVKRNWDLRTFGGNTMPRTNTVYAMVSDAFGNWGTSSNSIFYKPGRLVLEVPSQFASIQAALDAASAGDIVYVAPGDYSGSFTIPPGVTLRGAGPSKSFFSRFSSVSTVTMAPNTAVEGFGGYWRVYAASGPTIIQNNRFDGGGGQVQVAAKALIRNNVFTRLFSTGLLVDGSSITTDAVVENNTFVGNSTALCVQGAQRTTRVVSQNNIFAFNNIAVVDNEYNDQFHRHIFSSFNTYWSNTNGNFGELIPGYRNYYQVMEGGDMTADPLFVDRLSGNFHPQTSSTSVNSGNSDASYNDPDGTRNDRGAYGGPSLNTAPVADFVTTPQVGNVGTFFTLDASPSFDRETETSKLLVRWDFNGDGTWDTALSTVRAISVQFTNLGTFMVGLEVRDSHGWVSSTNKPMVVANQNPLVPQPSSVQDGSRYQHTLAVLTWTGADPDAFDTVTYDVFFGTTANPPLVASDLPAPSFAPPLLAYNTFYYWQVVAKDNHGGTTPSPVYSFLTETEPLPVRFVSFMILPGQYFELTFTNEPDRSYSIEASTNLVNWVTLTNFPAATATTTFRDAEGATLSNRFYRIVSP